MYVKWGLNIEYYALQIQKLHETIWIGKQRKNNEKRILPINNNWSVTIRGMNSYEMVSFWIQIVLKYVKYTVGSALLFLTKNYLFSTKLSEEWHNSNVQNNNKSFKYLSSSDIIIDSLFSFIYFLNLCVTLRLLKTIIPSKFSTLCSRLQMST